MIIPFIGVFISLTIWGTFLPVPGITTPNDPLVKRISTAMEITTMAKGIHDLAEIATASARGSYKQKCHPSPDPEPPIDIITPLDTVTITTTTALSTPQTKALSIPQTKALTVHIPLREPPHPDASKVCIPPPGFFVPYRYRSMTPCFICSLLTLTKVATIVWFVSELVLLMGRMAWAVGRDVYDAFAQETETGPQPRAVVDSPTALYDEIDALVEGSGSAVPDGEDVCCFPFQGAGAAVAATQPTLDMYPHCKTHTETETKTKTVTCFSNPRHQRAPVSPAAGEGTAPEASADEVRSVDDADLDATAAWAPPYAPARHWALVVRRLENVPPFFCEFFSGIFDGGQVPLPLPPILPSPSPSQSSPSQSSSSLPPPQQQHQHQQEKQQQLNEDTIQGPAADTNGDNPKRKRKRPSQAKRRRYARRKQREQQGGNEVERENGVDASWGHGRLDCSITFVP